MFEMKVSVLDCVELIVLNAPSSSSPFYYCFHIIFCEMKIGYESEVNFFNSRLSFANPLGCLGKVHVTHRGQDQKKRLETETTKSFEGRKLIHRVGDSIFVPEFKQVEKASDSRLDI